MTREARRGYRNSTCRRRDRSGVPRSCHRRGCASRATDPVVLFRLLSRIPYTAVARQGHAGPPIGSADRFGEDRGISTGRRSASPIRAPRGLIGGGFHFCVESGDQGAEPLATSSSALSSLPTHPWAAQKMVGAPFWETSMAPSHREVRRRRHQGSRQ